MINDRENGLDKTLNPQFFRSFELDVRFPNDWFLEIEIYDKSLIELRDTLIGRTIIDLEQRRYGDSIVIALEILSIETQKIDEKIRRY